MRSFLAILLLAALSGCAGSRPKPEAAAKDAERLKEYGQKLRQAFELGREEALKDPGFVERLEDEVLAETLRAFSAPMAGARRLLAFQDQRPQDPLNAIFLPEPDARGRRFALEDDPEFLAGTFFNSYDKAMFQPFFRQALLGYLQAPSVDDGEMERLAKALKMGSNFTARYAGFYPNQLSAELKEAMLKLAKEQPGGWLEDRLRFLILWDERNGAWASKRAQLDRELSLLGQSSKDELLKLEIADALAVQGAKPEKAFWMSLALPGLGQVANGDLQGGILLGGLTAAAWIWLAGKLSLAASAPDAAARGVAQGDAAWAGGLAALGHLFTAYNAAEQARFINISIAWDILKQPRLK